jgi:hypothetical protein
METKAALRQRQQGFDVLAVELSRGDQFFKFFFH